MQVPRDLGSRSRAEAGEPAPVERFRHERASRVCLKVAELGQCFSFFVNRANGAQRVNSHTEGPSCSGGVPSPPGCGAHQSACHSRVVEVKFASQQHPLQGDLGLAVARPLQEHVRHPQLRPIPRAYVGSSGAARQALGARVLPLGVGQPVEPEREVAPSQCDPGHPFPTSAPVARERFGPVQFSNSALEVAHLGTCVRKLDSNVDLTALGTSAPRDPQSLRVGPEGRRIVPATMRQYCEVAEHVRSVRLPPEFPIG